MAKTTVPGLYIADGAITAAKLSSTLDLSGVTITVATASTGDNDTTVASTAFVQQEIAALVDSSPSALNTLNELAAAIGDDASFSTTVTNSIATKLALAGGTMTGDLIINTTGSLQIPVGTTAQRPTAAQGQLRFNTTTSKPEIYNGSAWADVGGGVESVNSNTGVVTLDTDDISEGSTNLYFTNARADARIAAADTDDLSEGSTNLYFTTARANSAIDGRLSGSTGVTVSNGAISIGQDVATSTSPTFQNLTLSGTDSVKVPSGTTAQRSGSPANGMLRYNSSTNEFEGYANSAWGAIGGDTTSSVDLYTATGNGSTATYDTGKNPQSENNTWVFIGGVYQPKSTYSFSGTEITLSENLPNGEDLEVITGTVSTYNPTDAILGQYNVTTSNTASYDTSLTTENENNVFVFIDGVYQPKSSYTYSGSTLTLDAVPTSGMSLEVLVTRSMNAATVTTGFLADDAVTTAKITDANVTAAKLASSLDLTGKTVTVATASSGDNDTSVASTAFVRQEITSLVDSAPAAMDTLNELAAALGDDANFSTTVTNSIATKAPLATPQFTNRVGIGVAAHATAGLNITNTSQHIRLNNGSELGIISVLSTGELELWGHGDGESINFRTGSGTGTVAMNVVGNNVGITNTSTLNANLHIGSSAATGDATNPALQIGGSNTYRLGMYTSAEGAVIANANGDDGLQFVVKTAGEAMRIDGGTGNVGIGTSSPSSKLETVGGDGITISNSGDTFLQLKTTGTTATNYIEFKDSGGSAGSISYNHTDNYLATKVNGAERMRIDSSGDVLIGQTSQTGYGFAQKLVVGDGDNNDGITIQSGSTHQGNLAFNHSDGTTAHGRISYQHGTNYMQFFVNNSEKMRINSSGQVGILTTDTHNRELCVKGEVAAKSSGSTDTHILMGCSDSLANIAATYQSSGSYVPMAFETSGSERMRIDAAGHLILGSNLSTVESGKLSVYTDATNDSAIYGYRSTSYFRIVPFLSNGAHSGLSNVNDSGLFFSDNFVIAKNVGGYYGMIVAGNGNIHIGTESEASGSTGGATFSADSSNRRNLILASTSTGNLELVEFRNPNGTVGTIKTNGTSTSYNTSSDYRLKENIDYDFTALNRVTQLKPARFNFITDEDTILDGFLAHEVSSIVPEAVSGEKDATKEEEYEITPAQYEDDGETLISEAVMGTRTVPVYQGIDQSKLVPLLTKAIQELKTELDAAKARLDEAGL